MPAKPTPERRVADSLPSASLLAFTGGSLDAFLYLEHGKVFAGAMTGNTVLAGIALLSHDHTDAIRHILPIVAFLIGVWIAKLLDDRVGALFVAPPAPAEATEEDAPEEEGPSSGAGGPSGAKRGRMQTREDALATLMEVAAYFERTEPQSLTAMALRETVRRARLSAAELMQELIPDVAQRSTMLARLGIHSEIPG